nr:hypothetical protein [Tanacetum cinerariifolium]
MKAILKVNDDVITSSNVLQENGGLGFEGGDTCRKGNGCDLTSNVKLFNDDCISYTNSPSVTFGNLEPCLLLRNEFCRD